LLETALTLLVITRRTNLAQNFFGVLLVPDPEAVTDALLYQGTTSQLAEKVDFSKRTKNGTRQDAPGTIREDWLMVLHPPNFALLLSIPTFSASCSVVPKRPIKKTNVSS